MDATGILIYGSMLIAHLALAWVLFITAWGRFLVSGFLLTVGYALLGYSVFPVFTVEPWHTLLTPLVLWADSTSFINSETINPRAVAGVIFVLAGIGFLASVILSTTYHREPKIAACPFDHKAKACETPAKNGKVEKKEEIWMH